ncbi:MAG: nuclear transport factor 2 family protein, partial [Acidimicrobiales bacterium]
MAGEPLASLGERHSLVRWTTSMQGAALADRANRIGDAEVVQPMVTRVSDAGLVQIAGRFKSDDLNAAVAYLVELHAEGELPAERRAERVLVANQFRDHRYVMGEGASIVDHRAPGHSTADDAVFGDRTWRVLDVLALTERLALTESVAAEASTSGPTLLLTAFGEDGLVQRVDLYEPADADAALTRFDELTTGRRVGDTDADSGPIADASEHLRQLWEWILASKWDAVAAHLADDALLDDRRPIVGARADGREAVMSIFRSAVEAGVRRVEIRPLATRGRRLSLLQLVYVGAEGEVESIGLHEVDGDGKLVRGYGFDPADPDAAFDELDARYLAGEGAPCSSAIRVMVDANAAYNREDWAAHRSFYADDCAIRDRRLTPQVLEQLAGPGDLVRAFAALRDLASHIQSRIVAFHAVSSTGAVAACHRTAVGHDGAEIENETIAVYRVRDGQFVALEFYAADELPAALRRFAELEADRSTTDVAPNAAFRSHQRDVDAQLAHDMAGVLAVRRWDYVSDDRRSGIRTLYSGHQQTVELLGSVIGSITDWTVTLLATRGDDLCLCAIVIGGSVGHSGPYEVPMLGVTQVDKDGVITRLVYFDPDDHEAAFAELDALYLTGEAEHYADALTPMFESCAAYNRADWVAFRAAYADDCVLVDHRSTPNTFGGLGGPDDYVTMFSRHRDLLRAVRARIVAVYAVNERGALTHVRMTGTSTEGAEIELATIVAYTAKAGRLTHLEHFLVEDVDAARRRFDEIGEPGTGPVLPPPNAASLAARRYANGVESHDIAQVLAVLTSEFVHDDRRLRNVMRYRGHAAHADALAPFIAAVSEVVVTPLATRGDRLSLHVFVVHGSGGVSGPFEIPMLQLVEVDAAGLVSQMIEFDSDEQAAAFAELDAMYLAGEGAAFRDRLALSAAYDEAHNRRDWEGARRLLDDECVLVDHRPGGWGTVTRPAHVNYHRALSDLAPDVQLRQIAILRIGDRAMTAVTRESGTDASGGPFHIDYISVTSHAGGRITLIELFPADQIDVALGRYDELEGRRPVLPLPPLNAAARASRRSLSAMVEHDRDQALACLAPGHVEDYRRSGLRYLLSGPSADEVYEDIDVIRAIDVEAVATRGDRLTLDRWVIQGQVRDSGPFEMAMLRLVETDERELIARVVIFDSEDEPAALAELDAFYIAGEGAAFAATLDTSAAFVDAYSRRDWRQLRSLLADDCVLVDHRLGGWGTLDKASVVAHTEGLIDLSADASMSVIAVLRVTAGGTATAIRERGTDANGGPFSMEYIAVECRSGDRVGRVELFSADQLDRALERFDELTAAPAVPEMPPPNAAARALRREAAAVEARDVAAVLACYTPHYVYESRRAGLRVEYTGLEAARQANVYAGAVLRVDVTPLATRGDRLALDRCVVRGNVDDTGPFEVAVVRVAETDANGLIDVELNFDPDDLDAAFAELDARFAAGEGAPYAQGLAVWSRLVAAYNRRDWDTMESFYRDDFVTIDHRRLGWGTLDWQGLRPLIQGMVELSP